MNFKDVEISDKQILYKFLQCQKSVLNDMTFGSVFAWKKTYKTQYAIINDVLVIAAQNDGKRIFQLTYNGDFVGAIEKLKSEYKEPVNIFGINYENIGLIKAKLPQVKFTYNRNMSDYIYYRSALASFSGKKYQSKRNHINVFIRQYGDPVIEPVSMQNLVDIIKCQKNWYQEHIDENIDDENTAVMSVFENWEALDMQGVALRVDGEICAYAIGETAKKNTVVEHFEKGLSKVENSYTVITNAFAKSLPKNIDFINREEDLGIEGLRKAKLSLNPCKLENKYMITV